MSQRPETICHMISSLDAHVEVDRWFQTEGADRDEQVELYFKLQESFGARGYIVGRVTMDPYAEAGIISHEEAEALPKPSRTIHIADNAQESLAIVLDPKGKLHWKDGMLDGDHLLMVLGPEVSNLHLQELTARGVSYLIAPEADIDPAWLLDQLAIHFDAKRVMVEGGGIINGLFLKAGLIDEISLLMVPAIDGAQGARNVFDTGEVSLKDSLKLSLLSVEAKPHQTVHLRYKVSN